MTRAEQDELDRLLQESTRLKQTGQSSFALQARINELYKKKGSDNSRTVKIAIA